MVRFARKLFIVVFIAVAGLLACQVASMEVPVSFAPHMAVEQQALSSTSQASSSFEMAVNDTPAHAEHEDVPVNAGEAGFGYVQLSDVERRFYDTLLAGTSSMDEKIELSSCDDETVNRCLTAIADDHPEIFWLSGKAQVSRSLTGATVVSPEYSMSSDEVAAARKRIEGKVDACLESLPADASEYRKVKAAYEFVIGQADYGKADNDQTMVGVFEDGKAVCAGYARAFQYVCHRAGLYCAFVRGSATNSAGSTEPHSWNIVKAGGDCYCVDCTWGEPSYSNDKAASVAISYDYLCVTSEEIGRTHTADKYAKLPQCTAVAYDYYRVNDRYFSEYDRETVIEALAETIDDGSKSGDVKFGSKQGYEEALADLIEGGAMSDHRIASRLAAEGESYRLSYVPNDAMYTIRFIW